MESPFAQKIKKALLGVAFVFLFFAAHVATAEAATLYFSPSSGSYTVGSVITTGIYVNTQDVAVNNADVVLDFPTDTLEVISVGKSGSIFSLWVEEPAFSNSSGTIRFNGGVPTPGFTGSGGKLVGISFRVKATGTASVVCSSAAVRANDGLGTDVLNGCGQAIFTLTQAAAPPPAPVPPPPAPVTSVPGAPTVTSSTHPNPARWYSNNNPVFSWALPASVTGVNVLADQNPTQDPGTRSDGRFATYNYEDVDEGNWFFHIRLRNANGWGPVTHFAFNIDRTAPTLPVVRLVQTPTVEDPQGAITFESQDSLSGVAAFVVSVDGVESARVNPADVSAERPYRLPAPTAGNQSVSVVAYDQAGNASQAGTLSYVVPKLPDTAAVAEAPAYNTLGPWVVNPWINFWGLWILLTLILILIILCIWLWRTRGVCQEDSVEKRTAVRMMERTLANLEKQLRGLERTHSKRPLTDEETMLYRSIRGQTHDLARSISALKGRTNAVLMLDAAVPKKTTRRRKA